ncbi:DNA-binding protein WhiA, partial [Mycobacteroides abscessus subsp. abscessus]
MREYTRDGASVDVFEIRKTPEIGRFLKAVGAPEAAHTLISTHCESMRVENLEAANRSRFI